MFDPWESLHKSIDESAKRQNNRIEQLKTEPCMDLAEVGDSVLVDACSVGKGRAEIPLEAEVLRIAGSAYEVRYLTYTYYDSEELVVEWVQSYVVLAVIKKR